MDAHDVELRNLTYRRFVELGRAPSSAELARETGSTSADIVTGWRRLHDQHAIVLNPATAEIRMANPFSAVPSAYRVRAGGRSWYANCAWDEFGIFAALHTGGSFDASCPDCGDPLSIRVTVGEPDRKDLLFHCLVSAAHWWDDIIFT